MIVCRDCRRRKAVRPGRCPAGPGAGRGPPVWQRRSRSAVRRPRLRTLDGMTKGARTADRRHARPRHSRANPTDRARKHGNVIGRRRTHERARQYPGGWRTESMAHRVPGSFGGAPGKTALFPAVPSFRLAPPEPPRLGPVNPQKPWRYLAKCAGPTRRDRRPGTC